MADESDGRLIPAVMGVLNVTPDSFSDGGRWAGAGAVAHGEAMFADGADWVDVGGESTRPGAPPVPAVEQIARVVPVIGALAARGTVSVDTADADVARAALGAGATVVNDVSALRDPRMADVIAAAGAGVVLMHMRGIPATMQRDTAYDDLVGEVCAALQAQAERARAAGIARIWLDPGLGFGKAPGDNPRLIAAVPAFKALGFPVLIGASRKSFIGRLTGRADPADRVAGSVGAAIAAAGAGADVVRVHDVRETRDALVVWAACREQVRC
ncbi:MAG: dihydropteroate synthase [Myxococcota bacterium]